MTNILIHKFIKNYDDVENPIVRRKYGTLSSFVGVICNVLLFALKYIMGTLSGSISIISDAFNNLSDSAGCIVTLLGYKMSSKPADKDHPFGHGRMEYLTTLFIAILILIVAFELLKDSANKIMNPHTVKFSIIVLASLIVSIFAKFWMFLFNRKLGNKINSTIMLATANDSKTDVIATGATCVSIISSLFTDLPIDGIMGVVVSIFIFKSGIDIVRETVDNLLGKPADPELVKSIKNIVMNDEKIIGIHDLVIHNYGPGNMIGSCHAEVKSSDNFIEVHDIIDQIEHKIHNELNIMMTIHMDPIEVDNENVNRLSEMVKKIILDIDSAINMHDFRVVSGDTHINLIFDIVVPYECKYTEDDIRRIINERLSEMETDYYAVITFDREF